MHEVFAEWNRGELDSYLIEITRDIFARKDEETGKPLVEMILDTAGQKGTGKWTIGLGARPGRARPDDRRGGLCARAISAMKEERMAASKVLKRPGSRYDGDTKEFLGAIHDALYCSKICSYAQGFALMSAAAAGIQVGPQLRLHRAHLAGRLHHPRAVPRAESRMPTTGTRSSRTCSSTPFFHDVIEQNQSPLEARRGPGRGARCPGAAFSSALGYYDSYRARSSPRTCSRRSGTTSAPTPTRGSTRKACSTRSG